MRQNYHVDQFPCVDDMDHSLLGYERHGTPFHAPNDNGPSEYGCAPIGVNREILIFPLHVAA